LYGILLVSHFTFQRSIPAPPEKDKFYSERDGILLEDESGRIRLTGDRLTSELLVTGVIMAALGMETPTGDFEVLDVCFAGLPPNESHATSHRRGRPLNLSDCIAFIDENVVDEWVALVSGLDIGSGVISEGLLQLLVEYLSGEAGGDDELALASMISRVIFVGNSLGLSGAAGSLEGITDPTEKKPVGGDFFKNKVLADATCRGDM
jgi:DNA polymerase delta subunit 2